VLRGAVAKIAGNIELSPEAELADTAAECEKVMDSLKKAATGE
jgi:hypothetical protein